MVAIVERHCHERVALMERWERLCESLGDPSAELTVEEFAPLLATFAGLRHLGHRFDVGTEALMTILTRQAIDTDDDSDSDGADLSLDLDDSDEDGSDGDEREPDEDFENDPCDPCHGGGLAIEDADETDDSDDAWHTGDADLFVVNKPSIQTLTEEEMEARKTSLTFSRKRGESIMINGNVEVRIVGVRADGEVKLNIAAPEDVVVDRREVHDKKASGEVKPVKAKTTKDYITIQAAGDTRADAGVMC